MKAQGSNDSRRFAATRVVSGRAAFTLIELIMVLIILTVIAAIVAPSIRAFASGRDKTNLATMFISLADYARTQAASEGKTYRLNLDPSQHTVWLTVQDGATYSSPTAGGFGDKFTSSDALTITTDIQPQQDGYYVAFTPGGRCDPARIWITDKDNRTVEVEAASATELFHIVPAAEMTK